MRFWFTFIVNLCRQFFPISEKGSIPNWTIYKHNSDKSKKFLAVGKSEILSDVCGQLLAYTSLYRGLEYLVEVRDVILVAFLLQDGSTALFLKVISQK